MNNLKITYRHIILSTLLLLSFFAANAAKFSYVYIQGDKETPFYVKLEDEMLPRYGKNYCIIPQLAPGVIHVKILFQQNLFPVQTFTIQVPENGYRGFLLMKKDDAFSLYDIQQQFYLQSGNTIDDDHVPVHNPQNDYVPTNIGPTADTTARTEEVSNESLAKELVDNTPNTASATPVTAAPVKKEVNGPDFIDIELNNSKTPAQDNTVPTGNKSSATNGNCSKAIDSELFGAIQKKADDKGDKNRLKYLLSKTEDNCFNTNQVRILAKALPNDPEKYTFLKKAYPKVIDPAKFPALESLLSTQEWKTYFKLILQ